MYESRNQSGKGEVPESTSIVKSLQSEISILRRQIARLAQENAELIQKLTAVRLVKRAQ